MQPTRSHEFWKRYLDAERSGADGEAEAALRTLFAALPVLEPPAGFALRVLARVGRKSIFSRVSVRIALAASLLVAALGAGWVAPAVAALSGLLGPAELLGSAIGQIAGLSVRFASGVAFWERLGELGAVLARAALEPRILTLLIAQVAVAAIALRALTQLSLSKRSSNHAVL